MPYPSPTTPAKKDVNQEKVKYRFDIVVVVVVAATVGGGAVAVVVDVLKKLKQSLQKRQRQSPDHHGRPELVDGQ